MSEIATHSSAPMPTSVETVNNVGGFSFDNVQRNVMIEQQMVAASSGNGASLPSMTKKTGTTIVGCVFNGGVVLGADTRATGGSEVAEKNCEKIHYLSPNIYCCGAGTAADTEKTTQLISSQLELLRMNIGGSGQKQSRVVTACTQLKRMLFKYQGHISAALVLGGVDIHGPHLYQIYPHGSTGKLPYTTMGSGSLAAMSVFESSWTENMTEEEALTLVKRAICAGIFNDLGSGSNCDTCVIRTDKDTTVEYTRGAVTPNDIKPLRSAINRSSRLDITNGTTSVLHTKFVPTSGLTLADVDVTTTTTEMET